MKLESRKGPLDVVVVDQRRKGSGGELTAMFPKILDQVRRIPKGRVSTYGDVAAASGHPGAAGRWYGRCGQAKACRGIA